MKHTAETLQAAFHYLFPDEVPEIKRLVRTLKGRPDVVNIGAGAGTSTLAILEAREDVHVYSIDKQLEDSPLGSLGGEMNVVKEAGHAARLTQMHGDSKKIGRAWFSEPRPHVSMVFIDGDHSFEGCAGDIVCWVRNLKPGGILAVHDFQKIDLYPDGARDDAPAPRPWPGVDAAVHLFLYPNFPKVSHVDSLIAFKVP